ITLAELIYGAEKSARPHENLTVVEQFCAPLDILPFAERAGSHYGQLWAEVERAGQPIGIHDVMIGGHARSEGLTVVTNNVREFQHAWASSRKLALVINLSETRWIAPALMDWRGFTSKIHC